MKLNRLAPLIALAAASVATAQPARGVCVTITSSGPTVTTSPGGSGTGTEPPASTAAATPAAGAAVIAAATAGVWRPNRRPSARKFGLTT